MDTVFGTISTDEIRRLEMLNSARLSCGRNTVVRAQLDQVIHEYFVAATGSATHGRSIYNALQLHPNEGVAHAIGYADQLTRDEWARLDAAADASPFTLVGCVVVEVED